MVKPKIGNAICSCFMLALATAQAGNGDAARAYVELPQQEDTACADRGGKRQYIRSMHETRTVKAYVVRYFMDVRQADRSILVLRPNKPPRKLGCTRVFDAEQRWEVIDAVFVPEQSGPDSGES